MKDVVLTIDFKKEDCNNIPNTFSLATIPISVMKIHFILVFPTSFFFLFRVL